LVLGWATQPVGAVTISELMYHPASDAQGNPTDETLEFLELHHADPGAVDLSGWAFDRGIRYVFPSGTVLQPGEHRVLARDPAALSAHHGLLAVLGPFEGALSNRGERLRLVDALGNTRIDFEYGVHGDWPAAAAGAGHSLVPSRLDADPQRPRHWQASRWMGGSPGAPEPEDTTAGVEWFLVPQAALARYFKGTSEPSDGGTAWTTLDFEPDRQWLAGPGGFGYSNDPAELASIRTVLNDMRGNYASVYARYSFVLSAVEVERLERLTARVTYDDGYVLYLNGVRLAAVNVNGNPPAYNTLANSSTDYLPEIHDLTPHRHLLRAGDNVLAIQGHNGLLSGSSDFVLAPELIGVLAPVLSDEEALRRVRINEFLARSDGDADWIELVNPNDAAVDLSGVWLSDQASELTRYAFPAGTILAPRAFLVVAQETLGFGLSAEGEAIFLTEPGLSFVIDAYAFGPQERDVSLGRFPDGGRDWYALEPPSPGLANDPRRRQSIVINELMYHAAGSGRDDYLELFHAGPEPVDLSGWRFQGIRFEFPDGFVLAPGQLVVLADDPPSAAATYGLPLEELLRYRGSLSNSGERISLLDANDVIVDTVAYRDRPPWPVTADGLGASLERRCIGEHFDRPEDWQASPIGAPTPLRPNTVTDCSPLLLLPVVINEIMYHPFAPSDDDRRTEFIELHNHSDAPVELAGWGLSGHVHYRFPNGAVIGPRDYVLLAWDPERVAELYQLDRARVFGPYAPGLRNGGGLILLYGADGRAVDAVRYDDDFPWPSAADGYGNREGIGHSLERRSPLAGSTDPANWEASLTDQPTPLQPNHRLTDVLPPVVIGLEVTPHPVTPADAPAITATVVSGHPIFEARLDYWVDDPEVENEQVFSLPMNRMMPDDEADTLEAAWVATLPVLPANAIVRYRIAVDYGAGWRQISPRPQTDVYAAHAYFVDPGIGTHLPGMYHLFVSSANWRLLHEATAAGRVSGSQPNPTWNLQVPAVFVGDGVVHDVTVRHQGSRWNRNNGSVIDFSCASHRLDGRAQVRSWRIRFPAYRNHRGIDVLILQKQSGWPQRVSFEMFRLAGVPVPRTSWAHLRINGCDYNPAAYEIERPGSDLVARWFPEVGDLFKSVGYTGDEGPWSWGDERLIVGQRNGFTQSQRYKFTYDRKTRSWETDNWDLRPDRVEPLIEGLHTARAAGPVPLRQYLAENFDLDLTLRYIATINYVGTFDDMFQNHFLYRKAEDGKWCVLPWDMDNTLGGAFGEANAHPFRGADESRIGSVGNRSGWWNRLKDSFFIAYETEFQAMFHYLNNHVYAPAQMRPVVEAIAAERGLGAGSVSSLMNHIQNRHDYLNRTLVAPIVLPVLALERIDGETLEFAWPLGAFGFTLQSTSRLDREWADVPEPVLSTGTAHVVRLRPPAQRQFYRLVR